MIKELAAQGITVSIDTMHAGVAEAALENGARSSTTSPVAAPTPRWPRLLADAGVPVGADALALGRPTNRMQVPHYRDVVREVRDELMACVDLAVAAGVDPA